VSWCWSSWAIDVAVGRTSAVWAVLLVPDLVRKGQAGSNWRLGENLILTFRTFDLIGRFIRRSGSYAWFDRTFGVVLVPP